MQTRMRTYLARTDADRGRSGCGTTGRRRRHHGDGEPGSVAVGVTRVADVTRLDTIGIPTFQAVRPLSTTLAVSQGKGVTSELARLSALLESIEIWHVEQPLTTAVTAPPRAVADQLGYDVSALPRRRRACLHDGLPCSGSGPVAGHGAQTLFPADVVRLSWPSAPTGTTPAFLASTNGLASGNTLIEAVLHGLYEVVERDATTASITGGDRGVRVDPASLGSAVTDELCALIERAGVTLEVRLLPSRAGLPCFLAWIACADYPAAMYGFGCHLNPEIALTRAVTEAAQTRLSYIAGAATTCARTSTTAVRPGHPSLPARRGLTGLCPRRSSTAACWRTSSTCGAGSRRVRSSAAGRGTCPDRDRRAGGQVIAQVAASPGGA